MDPYSALIGLLLNKYTIGIAAALAALAGVYLKGRSAGADSVKGNESAARDKLNNQISSTEQKNQTIEQGRAENAEKIDATDNVDDLSKLLNDIATRGTDGSNTK